MIQGIQRFEETIVHSGFQHVTHCLARREDATRHARKEENILGTPDAYRVDQRRDLDDMAWVFRPDAKDPERKQAEERVIVLVELQWMALIR